METCKIIVKIDAKSPKDNKYITFAALLIPAERQNLQFLRN
jgi:hypothetical protein